MKRLAVLMVLALVACDGDEGEPERFRDILPGTWRSEEVFRGEPYCDVLSIGTPRGDQINGFASLFNRCAIPEDFQYRITGTLGAHRADLVLTAPAHYDPRSYALILLPAGRPDELAGYMVADTGDTVGVDLVFRRP